MKKKILIGAFALVSLLGGTFAYETFSGQKEAAADCRRAFSNNDGICVADMCTAGYDASRCNIGKSNQINPQP